MGGVIATLIVFIMASATAYLVFVSEYSQQKTVVDEEVRSKALQIAKSGLYLTREDLSRDDNWTDCLNADRNCSSIDVYGYFPLYSLSLNSTAENLNHNGGKLTVLINPIDQNSAKVISIGEFRGKKVFIGGVFKRGTSSVRLPVVYGGLYSYVYGGKLCSYYWDGSSVVGKTLPNFASYLDTTTYISADIYVPAVPAGTNPKNVFFGTNFSTRIEGYKVIDELYSTGNVLLLNGAKVGKVVSNGTVTIDSSSSAGSVIENANWKFPSFNKNLQDLSISDFNTGLPYRGSVICDRNNRNVIVQTGKYDQIIVNRGCETVTFQGGEVNVTGSFTVYSRAKPEIKNASDVSVLSRKIYNYGNVTANPTASFILRAFDFYNGAWFSNSSFKCSNPSLCLVDVNNFYNYGTIQSVLLGRNYVYGSYGSTFIGNVLAERIYTRNSTVCNIVDSSGSEVGTSNNNIFTLIGNPEIISPIVNEVTRVICSSVADCNSKF